MKILHYTLGFQPQRTGGLVAYSTDLINEQKRSGNTVVALYPGKINFIYKKPYIKNNKNNIYELVNSLPLPLFGGIKTPKDFMCPTSKKIYRDFLEEIRPQIIHVHTLMGIHKEFFIIANELNIPIVYTSHDYFGLASEPNFFYNGISYDHSNSVDDWMDISSDALSTSQLRLFQLRLYPLIRRLTKLVNKEKILSKNAKLKKNISDVDPYDFYCLKNYYQDIFNLIDRFHFNSNIAKDVYTGNIKKGIKYEIISITNSRIEIRKTIKKDPLKKTRVAYIGPFKDFKGIDDFIFLAEKMKNMKNFEFHTFGYKPKREVTNIYQHGKFSQSQFEKVYQNIDVLVVPSKWKETFGLIVLEARSFGIKVFASKNVGASELLSDQFKFSSIKELEKRILYNKDMNQCDCVPIKIISTHETEIMKLYRKMVSE